MEKKHLIKIAVVGAESTGKTWLCERLAAHFKTVWVPEYAREYFNNSDIYNYTLADLELIAEEQIQRENDCMQEATGFLFCDTAMITLKIWADLEFGGASDKLRKTMSYAYYDFYLITDNSVEWQEDPLRQNKFSRDLIHNLNVEAAKNEGVPFAVVAVNGPGISHIFELLKSL